MHSPTDPVERSRYDAWWLQCVMELAADTMYIIRRHGDLFATYGEAPRAVEAAKVIFAKQAQATVQRLGSGPYVMGERFTGADILLTTCLANAQRRDIALPSELYDYLSRTTAREGYQRAVEANQRPGRSNLT